MNRKGTKLCSLLLAALLALSSAGLTSCTRDKTEEKKEETKEEERTETVQVSAPKTAVPAEGVGRIIPEVVISKNRLICIDPGHGFIDGGTGDGIAELNGLLEKDINLAIATMLDEDLKKMGYQTIMTHNGVDTPPGDLDGNGIFSAETGERTVYINSLSGVDYVVSIHVNATGNNAACGMQIHYEQSWCKVNDWSEPIAEKIADRLYDEVPDVGRPAMWGNDADYSLILTRETAAAASLIEVGFCTNVTDAQNMIKPEWQALVAQAIANGIDDFFVELDGEG